MLRAALEGNPTHLSRYFRDILPNILTDFQSPLAAPDLSSLYTQLRQCVFSSSQSILGKKISCVYCICTENKALFI